MGFEGPNSKPSPEDEAIIKRVMNAVADAQDETIVGTPPRQDINRHPVMTPKEQAAHNKERKYPHGFKPMQ